MIKITFICIAILALFGAGCSKDDNIQDQAQFKAPEQLSQSVVDKAVGLGCKNAVVPSRDKTLGHNVQWQGVFCGLSQINGIKLCFWDDDLGADGVDDCNWFWGIPEIIPGIDEYNGKWATWMLKKYGDIDAGDLGDDEILIVTGKYVFDDCTFYDDADICIPNVEVERIEVRKD